jgi:hypothetical protein
MKNFILSIVLIAAIAAILQPFLPWWIIAPVAFAVGFIFQQKSVYAFLAGFVAIFALWTIYAFLLSQANHDILAKKIAELLPLKGHVSWLILTTGAIGGLVSGLSAVTGRWSADLR